jgi:hypothetical protein
MGIWTGRPAAPVTAFRAYEQRFINTSLVASTHAHLLPRLATKSGYRRESCNLDLRSRLMNPFRLARLWTLIGWGIAIAILGLWRDPLTMFVILAIPASLYFFLTWIAAPKKAPAPKDSSDWRPRPTSRD